MLEIYTNSHNKKIELSSPENPTNDDIALLTEKVNEARRREPDIVLGNIIHTVLDKTTIPIDEKQRVSRLISNSIQQREGVRLPNLRKPIQRMIARKKSPISTGVIDFKMRQAGDDTIT